jgi:hypothetical protein
LAIYLSNEANARVDGDIAAGEIGFNNTAVNGWKSEWSLVAFYPDGSS